MRIKRELAFVLAVLNLVWLVAADCGAQQRSDPKFNPKVVIPDPIRPIVDAPVVPANKASDDIVVDNELVLGVVVNGEARAYPINMISGPQREIINDDLGGRAIAATW